MPTVRCSRDYRVPRRSRHLQGDPLMPATPVPEGEPPPPADHLATNSEGSEEERVESHPASHFLVSMSTSWGGGKGGAPCQATESNQH